jgi:transaldolase/glucose-6-phosphate isomerase
LRYIDEIFRNLIDRKKGMNSIKDNQTFKLGAWKTQVEERLKLWKKQSFSRRLWEKDPTLWFSKLQPEIIDRLGWLALPEMMQDNLEELSLFAEQVKKEGISHIILFGMGGSSLAPDVFRKTFANVPGYPRLLVLDSTHPSAVLSVENKLDLNQTLFIVSSKSGTTLETLSLFRYFWSKVSLNTDNPGRHFIAITDSGSPLMKLAQERGFRRIFEASSDVGGRYSAFTYFGMVPASLIGMDIYKLLDRARAASENCASGVSEEKAAGIILGASLGEIGQDRNKLTFIASDSIRSFPDWLEQLIAESTGKEGKGILPVAGEPLVSVYDYGQDRFFVFMTLAGESNSELEGRMKTLKQTGHPYIRIDLSDKYDLGREIFSWEVAVASAGSVLGIHPFNQPDVQLAKDFTKKAVEKIGNEKNKSSEETQSLDKPGTFARALKDWLGQVTKGDYIALQAYLPPSEETTEALQDIRSELLKRTRLATTIGYGPRFLHSTGQLHKGGPNNGLFLQIVDEPNIDLPVPETDYSFTNLIKAQAIGDFRALQQRGRRVLRVNLKSEFSSGLKKLYKLISLVD